jgi:F0F1-type ATP synthase membrane subunit c/vacuolar-type H+-ATPase subunit K
MLLLGFKFVASSIPLISLAGVAIGVGLIFACLVLSICRNPVNEILDQLIRFELLISLNVISGNIISG